MKCKDCILWERYLGYKGKPEQYGTCQSDYFVDYNDYSIPKNGVASWDYEGYRSGMFTGEDFGCIHFENKKE